ncbi:hypothetical protein Barb6_02773 [Bacteroidales bacterium Barb6]|nr:hypothetical protein Barb6_02773 [Bacteroidales bacterium Barb6]
MYFRNHSPSIRTCTCKIGTWVIVGAVHIPRDFYIYFLIQFSIMENKKQKQELLNRDEYIFILSQIARGEVKEYADLDKRVIPTCADRIHAGGTISKMQHWEHWKHSKGND